MARERQATRRRPQTRISRPNRTSPLTAKGHRSRDGLVDAARKVFAREGFQSARITDIAEAAGVAHGTFYTYFDSKTEIFLALLHRLEDELRYGPAGKEAIMHSDDLITQIYQANHRYLESYLANKEMMVVWEQAATLQPEVAQLRDEATSRFVQRIEEAIVRMKASDQIDAALVPHYAAHALTGMVSRFAYSWVLRGEPFKLDEASNQLSRLWTNALGLTRSEMVHAKDDDGKGKNGQRENGKKAANG